MKKLFMLLKTLCSHIIDFPYSCTKKLIKFEKQMLYTAFCTLYVDFFLEHNYSQILPPEFEFSLL